jgi:hypothetical protein
MNAKKAILMKVIRVLMPTAVLDRVHVKLSLSNDFDRARPHISQAMEAVYQQ